jgi:lipoprotein-anchoring transpeptidase ErfK/SrfK
MRSRYWLSVAIAALAAVGCGSSRPPGHGRAFTAVHGPPPLPAIPPGSGALVAQVIEPTVMRAAPAGRPIARIGVRDEFGSPDDLAVVTVDPAWLGVTSAFAGNGRLGWIPRGAAALSRVPYRLRASLTDRTLTVLDAGKPVKRYMIGIGASWAPTPTGRFAVTDRLTTGNPHGPYGCCILALSATAPHAIPGWPGGNRIAVHATPASATIGQPDSHGCMHVTQADASWLIYHVPIGTPIVVSAR